MLNHKPGGAAAIGANAAAAQGRPGQQRFGEVTDTAGAGAQGGVMTPTRILQIVAGYQPLYALATALDLSLFTHISRGSVTTRALVAATGASERGLRRLLDVLVGLDLIKRTGEDAQYELAPESASFLVEDRPSYLGGYVRFAASRLSKQWGNLTEVVRTGRPAESLDTPEEGESFWEELVELLFPWNYPLASYLGQILLARFGGSPARLLDVAAGSGVWGIAAAQANPAMRVVALDLPRVLEHARRRVEQFGLSERFEFRGGDIRRDVPGDSEFDVAVLGQICHSEGPEHSRALLRKVARALKPDGLVVIADMMPNEERSGPLFTLMYALSMLITTTDGGTFTFAEYGEWLKEAGFRDAHVREAMGQTLLLASRA